MDKMINLLSATVRKYMSAPAKFLNTISGGRIRPNHVTLVSLLGHVSVVWALWYHRPIVGAVLLAFFGIMDSLDGALARLQNTSSITGMLYDAVSDRVKEVMVYIGIVGLLSENIGNGRFVNSYVLLSGSALAAAVCGMSLVVSYIKAKGEVAASGLAKHNTQELNRVFADGIARYEIRMFLVIVGLLTGHIVAILWVLLVLICFTALQRIVRVSNYLKKHHV